MAIYHHGRINDRLYKLLYTEFAFHLLLYLNRQCLLDIFSTKNFDVHFLVKLIDVHLNLINVDFFLHIHLKALDKHSF